MTPDETDGTELFTCPEPEEGKGKKKRRNDSWANRFETEED